MKTNIHRYFFLALCTIAFGQVNAERKGPWSEQKAWQWYDEQPWIRGCNYMSADCANRIDQWQKLGFEERFETQKKEMALAESIGFNTFRLILAEGGFGVWLADRKGFLERFDRTLSLCKSHGIRAIITLGNDCSRPKQLWKKPKPGKQHYDIGYHGGRKLSQHGSFPNEIGYTSLDNEKLAPKFFEMCRELMTKYKDDDRILFWNLWNEPGNNGRGDITKDHLRKLFEIAWEIDPKQPLAADLWQLHGLKEGNNAEKVAAELSDIISYHMYSPLSSQQWLAKQLKERYGRPMINTEWMARILDCNITDCYGFFQQNRIGCTMWGFVAGKYQTYEPWEGMWRDIDNGGGKHYKITRWFHDLYRPSLRPYDPYEIEIIKHINGQADEEYKAKTAGSDSKDGSLRQKIAAHHKIISEDIWYGYRRTKFDFEGMTAWVVEPSVKPKEGMPWTWTMQWAEAFVDRTGVLNLLKEGYHHVTIEAFEQRASDEVMPELAAFQQFLTEGLGFADKSNLIGMSWGGFFSVRYAANYPQNVRKIYLDAPLLNFQDWIGDIGPWKKLQNGKWEDDERMPINMVQKLADAKIPILLLYGGQDQTVNPERNCELFAKRFKDAGGEITIDKRGGYGHHPHGTDPDKTSEITNFIKK